MTNSDVLGLNWQTYQRLKVALSLSLRRQIFIAVCDDLTLRNRLVTQLQTELLLPQNPETQFSELVSLNLDTTDPNPLAQIAQWLAQHLPASQGQYRIPQYGFQILGIERLTRQPLAIQGQFLKHLKTLARSVPTLEFSLLVWVPKPWLLAIRQSASEFWSCHTGLFEFVGEPTPLPEEFLLADIIPESQQTLSLAPVGAVVDSAVLSSKGSLEEPVEAVVEPPAPPSFETYLRLANSYRDRIEQGEASTQNLRLAIQAYEQALEFLEVSSPLLPDLLNDLGNLYWMVSRTHSTASEALPDLEQGIKLYEMAIARLDPHHPSDLQAYARLQNNLGTAYSDLARYREPAQSLQKAIAAYSAALQYRQPQPEGDRLQQKQYAMAQNNLGTAYWNLAQHQEPAQNLKQAIAAYQEAQHYYSSEAAQNEQDALSYAMIHNNLGTAYWNLAQYEQPEHYLLMAVWSYQIALNHRTPAVAPLACAATQNNLGTTYWHLAHCPTSQAAKRADHLKLCITAYEAALNTLAQFTLATGKPIERLNFDYFATHNNLGLAHYQLFLEIQAGDRPLISTAIHPNLEAALHHHIQAWQGWQNRSPELARQALDYILQTLRTIYTEYHLPGQNYALSKVPASLLPEILRRI